MEGILVRNVFNDEDSKALSFTKLCVTLCLCDLVVQSVLNKIPQILFCYLSNYFTNAATGHLYLQQSRYSGGNICHVCFPVGFTWLDIPAKKQQGNMCIIRGSINHVWCR